jgi:hypothetical protein
LFEPKTCQRPKPRDMANLRTCQIVTCCLCSSTAAMEAGVHGKKDRKVGHLEIMGETWFLSVYHIRAKLFHPLIAHARKKSLKWSLYRPLSLHMQSIRTPHYNAIRKYHTWYLQYGAAVCNTVVSNYGGWAFLERTRKHGEKVTCHMMATLNSRPGWQRWSEDAVGFVMLKYLHVCLYMCIYLSINLSINQSIYLYINQSIYLSIYISIYLFIYLSIYLSIHLSIYLSI